MQVKKWLPKFGIFRLAMGTMLLAILLAMIVNARRQQPAQRYNAICCSPDGSLIALCGEENTQILDLETGKLKQVVAARTSKYLGSDLVSFLDDGRLAIVGRDTLSSNSRIFLYDLSNQALASHCGLGANESVAVAPDGFAIASQTTALLEVYTYVPDKCIEVLPLRKSNDRLRINLLGDQFTLFDGFHQSRLPGGTGPTGEAVVVGLDSKRDTIPGVTSDAIVSPRGSEILVAGPAGAKLLSTATQETLWRWPAGIDAEDSRFSPDGQRVAIQCKTESITPQARTRDYFISVLDVASGEELLRVDVCDRLRSAFQFSNDGGLLIVAQPDEYFRGTEVWDIKTKKLSRRIGGSGLIARVVLYPLFALFWAIVWAAKSAKPQNSAAAVEAIISDPVESKSTFIRRWLRYRRPVMAVVTLLGFCMFSLFSTICFFTMSQTGAFGQLPVSNQIFATLLVCAACLAGVWIMVVGLRNMLR